MAILGLALLNPDVCFRDPLSWRQLISWPLLVISAILVIAGVRLLGQQGEPDANDEREGMRAFFNQYGSSIEEAVRVLFEGLAQGKLEISPKAFQKQSPKVVGRRTMLLRDCVELRLASNWPFDDGDRSID